jgi:23S rRNA pseudouridine1911/1915/1917 synthase
MSLGHAKKGVVIRSFPRQALHAHRLRLVHPATLLAVTFEAPLPEDMKELLARLEADSL